MSFATARLSSVKPNGVRAAAPARRAAATPRGAVVVRAGDLVDTAKASGFTTLVAAVEAAGLTATLKSAGPFTVFAPTNEAFAALPAGTLDRLLKPENKQELTNILLYHVLKNKNLSRHVANAPSIPTLNPDGIRITVDTKTGGKGVVRVGCKEQGKQGLAAAVIGGKITQADIVADNGLVHVIDAVLIPVLPPPDNNGFAPDSTMRKD